MKAKKDRHHLIPKGRFGQDLDSNMILIKRYRHVSWHQLWGNLTLKEIITLLKKVRSQNRFEKSPPWESMWSNRSISLVISILERVYRIKKQQEIYLLLN